VKLLASVLIGLAATLAIASPIGRVVRTMQTIDAVNLSSNSEASISTTTFATDSLAMDTGGSMFSANSSGNIYNVTSPMPFLVGSTGFTQIGDLDYANNGLWGYSNASGKLFFFDFGSSTVTYQAAISGLGIKTVTGVAFNPTNGSVFLSAYNGLNNDFLFEVGSSSTTAVLKGAMAQSDTFSYISDIDFDPSGTLYAMTWYHRDFYTVNAANGATSLYSNGPHRDVTGMALEAVPEPGTIAVILGGMAMLRRSRKR
jgi:hypothetical protein